MSKSENTPSQTTIKPGQVIELSTRYGSLSRGKCWGKFYADKRRPTGDFVWVEKNGGTLYLNGSGFYVVGSSDGFNRDAKAEFYLAPPPASVVKEEAKQAATVTMEQAVKDCWTILQTLPAKEAKKVLAALKDKVNPPKPKTDAQLMKENQPAIDAANAMDSLPPESESRD